MSAGSHHVCWRRSHVADRGTRAAARADATHRMLVGLAENDPEMQARLTDFWKGLRHLDGRKAAMCTSTIALLPLVLKRSCSQESWSPWNPTLFSHNRQRPPLHVRQKAELSQSYCWRCRPDRLRFHRELSRPEGNLTGLLLYGRASLASGWRCSRRFRHPDARRHSGKSKVHSV